MTDQEFHSLAPKDNLPIYDENDKTKCNVLIRVSDKYDAVAAAATLEEAQELNCNQEYELIGGIRHKAGTVHAIFWRVLG